MGLRFPAQIHGQCFFVTFSFADRRRHGQTPGVYEALADSLRFYLSEYEARLAAYVLMPSHVHLLIIIEGVHLSSFVRDFKKYTAQKSLQRFGVGKGQVWEERYDRVAVYSPEVFRRKLGYIHNNPVKAGLSDSPETWFWCSAADYAGRCNGPVAVWTEWCL